MAIEIKIFGFGDDRPESFQGKNRLRIDVAIPTTPRQALRSAGIEDANELVLMMSDRVIPISQWDDATVNDKSVLSVLCAFEGG